MVYKRIIDSRNELKNPQQRTSKSDASRRNRRNWPLKFLALLVSLMLLKKTIGAKNLVNLKQDVFEQDEDPKSQTAGNPSAAQKEQDSAEIDVVSSNPNTSEPIELPKELGKWKKYCFVLLINFLLWSCIGIGIFLVLLVSNGFGFTESLPEKIAGTEKFFDRKFLNPLVFGILVMITILVIVNYIILKLRKKIPLWNKINREIIPDSKFVEIFQSEIVGQVNNIANLATFSAGFLIYDQGSFGDKILDAVSGQSGDLLVTAAVLYSMAAFFYWKFVDD